MQLLKDFTGCNAIIRYTDSEDIIDRAPIISHNRSTLTITVSSNKIVPSERQISILILSDTFVYEYCGVVRKARGSTAAEISLFKGKLKRGRAATRHELNKAATAIANKNGGYAKSYEVTVVNVSVSGVLMKASSYAFEEGDNFKLKIIIGENPTVINTKVIRKKPVSAAYSLYGCELISIVEE